MRLLELSLRNFRGFRGLVFQPSAQVALVGEPRAGRSDLIAGLRRVLTSDGTRRTTPSELDFWMLDLDSRPEVEVVVGDLGPVLEQDFLDHLEEWDAGQNALAEPGPPTLAAATRETEWVLRLCYRIKWDPILEQPIHWVDFPGESDPDSDSFSRVPRRLQDLLPVVVIASHKHPQPLRLGPQSAFRRVAEGASAGQLGSALDDLVESIADAGDALAKTDGIKSGVAAVLKPVQGPLGVDAATDGLVQFVPEGGSLTGILRSLQPALNLGGPGHLPLDRHGATASALLQAGEAIAAIGSTDAIVLVDDFGEDLDSVSARHLASVLRQAAAQAWISTRRSAVVEPFPPEDIVRLHNRDGDRRAAQIGQLKSKAERIAARHMTIQLLPAASAAVLAIVEGPHDRAALLTLIDRLGPDNQSVPSANGIAIVDAGAADGSGGASAVARLASLAGRLGFHTIGVIDGDTGTDGASYLAEAEQAADCVIRLPDGAAIERAITDGISEESIAATLSRLCEGFGVASPPGLETLTGRKLMKAVVGVLKKNGGLHAQFLELLPEDVRPTLLVRMLDEIVRSGTERSVGLRQL